ncbi:MAG: hypothetical protein ACREJ6_10470 [Candidatus Methylomirabilis sp.]
MSFLKAKIPPPPPERDDAAVVEARRKALLAQQQSKGRASTILTSGQGLAGDPNVSRATLLSGAA